MNIRTATPADIDARMIDLQMERARIDAELAAIDAEYRRRGGWTRAFVVPGGHAHTSTACSTCYPTTRFALVARMSGMTEEAIVDEAGERACTVCYPSAPVETLRRPTRLYSPEEEAERAEREAAKAEREVARAKRDAKAITTPEGAPLKDSHGFTVKTERTAEIEAVAALTNTAVYRAFRASRGDEGGHPSEPEWLAFVDRAVEALAHKRGVSAEEVRKVIETKAAAKTKRELRDAGL